jgi:ribosomal protein L23
VRTQIHSGQLRRVGRFTGYRADTKKAFVKLAQGQSIDFFQGA